MTKEMAAVLKYGVLFLVAFQTVSALSRRVALHYASEVNSHTGE